MGLINNLWRGFAGGADLNRQKTLRFLLEDTQVQIRLPYSNVETEEQLRIVNYPYKTLGWFENHMEQQRQHHFVHLQTRCWFYLFPLLRFDDGQQGRLFCSLRLKRVPTGVNVLDRQQLANYVIQEYDEHYNANVMPDDPCEQARGVNTQTRQKLRAEAELAASRGATYRLDNLERMIALAINYPPLEPAQIIAINGQDWVFYQDRYFPGGDCHIDCYCLPLSEQYYLTIDFDLYAPSYGNKRWLKHAKATQQMILDSLIVSPVDVAADNLLVHTSDQTE